MGYTVHRNERRLLPRRHCMPHLQFCRLGRIILVPDCARVPDSCLGNPYASFPGTEETNLQKPACIKPDDFPLSGRFKRSFASSASAHDGNVHCSCSAFGNMGSLRHPHAHLEQKKIFCSFPDMLPDVCGRIRNQSYNRRIYKKNPHRTVIQSIKRSHYFNIGSIISRNKLF